MQCKHKFTIISYKETKFGGKNIIVICENCGNFKYPDEIQVTKKR